MTWLACFSQPLPWESWLKKQKQRFNNVHVFQRPPTISGCVWKILYNCVMFIASSFSILYIPKRLCRSYLKLKSYNRNKWNLKAGLVFHCLNNVKKTKWLISSEHFSLVVYLCQVCRKIWHQGSFHFLSVHEFQPHKGFNLMDSWPEVRHAN